MAAGGEKPLSTLDFQRMLTQIYKLHQNMTDFFCYCQFKMPYYGAIKMLITHAFPSPNCILFVFCCCHFHFHHRRIYGTIQTTFRTSSCLSLSLTLHFHTIRVCREHVICKMPQIMEKKMLLKCRLDRAEMWKRDTRSTQPSPSSCFRHFNERELYIAVNMAEHSNECVRCTLSELFA